MKLRSLLPAFMALLAVSAATPVPQEKGIMGEGGAPDDRASARVLYWNQRTNSSAGQFAIDYGRPRWKKDYEDPAKFDAMTKGKVWRMGSNYWTTLDTEVPLKISGKDVPVGSYYLGMHRSPEGHWSLAFIDPGKARGAHLDAFEIQKAPIEFEAPLSVAKPAKMAEKLTITLTYPKARPKNVTLKVLWGNLALVAPVAAAVPE